MSANTSNTPTGDTLAELASTSALTSLESHRPLVGFLVVRAKRLAARLARWCLAPVLARQEAFNRAVAAELATRRAERSSSGAPPDDGSPGALARRIELVHESLHREITSREAAILRSLREEVAVKTSQALAAIVADAQVRRPLAEGFGDHLYREFVSRFRGSEEEIGRRFELYTKLFADADPVIDVGCGRGEFLAALRERGIGARGVDSNAELVEHCVSHGLDVARGEALEHLGSLDAGSLGGVFSAQVLEHLEPAGIQAFLGLAHRVLRPGGLLVAETVNAESLAAITRNFFADWTHRTPIVPRSLRFVAERCGFAELEIRYLSPVPENARLRIVPIDPDLATSTRDQLEAINRNFELLNALLFGPQDFALIARKPA